MEKHHEDTINIFIDKYKNTEGLLAVLLAGSLAHGFAKSSSDVDILLIITDEEYEKKKTEKKLAFSVWDFVTYKGGYVDCKFLCPSSIKRIADKGSDPARYAFKDSVFLLCRDESLKTLIQKVSVYPQHQYENRRYRFVCQILAWKWYMSQAEEKESLYLKYLSAQRLVLFACRSVLNENAMLYPYHKWLLKETEMAKNKPGGFMGIVESFLSKPSFTGAQSLADSILAFLGVKEQEVDWSNQFMKDSEMNWIEHEAPIDDI